MKHTVTLYVLEDDNLFEGHELELTFDDEFRPCFNGMAFDSIQSVGHAPLSTKLLSDYVENCFLADDILEAIQGASNHEVTLSDIEDVCNSIHYDTSIILDTDYSVMEAAA